MLSPADIQRACLRKYPDYLRAVVSGEAFFPLPIRFGQPSTTGDWNKLRQEIGALKEGSLGYRIEWVQVNTRKWGQQRFPERVYFENEQDFLQALAREDEVKRFKANVALTREICPSLDPWLVGNTRALVENGAEWPDLLKVCLYLLANPFPHRYARELPIPVHTKFIEQNHAILRKLLDFLLPEGSRTTEDRFELRYGLRYDEPLVRLRLLDKDLQDRFDLRLEDVSVPLTSFNGFNWKDITVFITENRMSFLTFPRVENAVVIWGGGCAVEQLGKTEWLHRCRMLYWGDIDVHGFHILSRLRGFFPHVQSLMMDLVTLKEQDRYVVRSKPSHYQDVDRLTEAEHKTYVIVSEGGSLLEQEKISLAYSEQVIRDANTVRSSVV